MSPVMGPVRVPFWEAFRFWLRLGFINFGGPTGQIAIMHQELVERRRWISNARFMHALSYCMLLPGPEAQQLATYIGWLLHRTVGGIIAGVFFILPSVFIMLVLSWLYATRGTLPVVAAVFYGLRAGVIAIVAAAVLRIGRRALHTPALMALAAAAFLALFVFGVPFPAVVVGAGLLGVFAGGLRPGAVGVETGARTEADGVEEERLPDHVRPDAARALRVLLAALAVWWAPLAAVVAWRGWDDVLAQEAIFFSKAAMVTFGGAYAVLAYIAQAAVEQYGWLRPGEMLDGLGLAESTPGPLIMVTEFVGYLGAFRRPGGLDPELAGALGALVTVWATFTPSFLWIFLGAPYIEHLRGNRRLQGALSAITAAVVGVILNLAVFLGLHTLFRTVAVVSRPGIAILVPRPQSLDLVALAIAVVAFIALTRWRWGIVAVVAASAAAGWLAAG